MTVFQVQAHIILPGPCALNPIPRRMKTKGDVKACEQPCGDNNAIHSVRWPGDSLLSPLPCQAGEQHVASEDGDEGDPEEAVELEGEGLREEPEGDGLHGAPLGDPEAGDDEEEREGKEEIKFWQRRDWLRGG